MDWYSAHKPWDHEHIISSLDIIAEIEDVDYVFLEKRWLDKNNLKLSIFKCETLGIQDIKSAADKILENQSDTLSNHAYWLIWYVAKVCDDILI